MPGITVGVDGSHHAQPALDWAVKEAGIRHAPLTVLAVHEVASNHWTGHPITLPPDEAEREKAQHAAETAVAQAVEEAGDPKPASVTVRAVNGLAAQELIGASQDADLIVVGARGGGGFAALVLGSVCTQVVHHAACPVVVVHPHHE
jgi:nucleotide-binding universal stress UspA family protein